MNMSSHNRNYGNLVPGRKVVEQSKWGNSKAYERYGSPQHFHGAPQPRDMSQPQGCGEGPFDQPPDHSGLPRPFNDARNDWKLGANEDATTMPYFDKSRGKAKP
jgi:hypothetical protein